MRAGDSTTPQVFWCPQHEAAATVDEDGCCVMCGCDCAILATAEADVLAERGRQRAKWADKHDDEHANGALAMAAAALVHPDAENAVNLAPFWSWDLRARARHDQRRQQLVIAAALAIAEIERLDRKAAP